MKIKLVSALIEFEFFKGDNNMSFFQKVKQFLGIVGVKVEMQVDDSFSRTGSVIQGKVIITSKSDQQILAVKVSFEETSARAKMKQLKILISASGMLSRSSASRREKQKSFHLQ